MEHRLRNHTVMKQFIIGAMRGKSAEMHKVQAEAATIRYASAIGHLLHNHPARLFGHGHQWHRAPSGFTNPGSTGHGHVQIRVGTKTIIGIKATIGTRTTIGTRATIGGKVIQGGSQEQDGGINGTITRRQAHMWTKCERKLEGNPTQKRTHFAKFL